MYIICILYVYYVYIICILYVYYLYIICIICILADQISADILLDIIAIYGARHHIWPIFVIAAILLSDVARRQLRYCCKAGNESYIQCRACDVRLLNYAWKNADWPTLASGRDYQPNTSACSATVPTVIPMLLSNAQILRRGHADGGWLRSQHAWRMQSRPRAVRLSPSRPLIVVLLNVPRAAVTESLTQLAVVDQRTGTVVVGEMLRQSETYPRRLISRRLVLDRGMKNCLPATSWRTRSHCCPCSTSELTANFFCTAAVVMVDRLPRLMMLQFSFVLRASLCAHGFAHRHNNTHAYFVSRWENYFRTTPTENSGPKFKFCLLRSLVKLLTFQNFKPKKSEQVRNVAKISLRLKRHYFSLFSLYFQLWKLFKNRSAHFVANHRLLATVHHK